MKLDEYLGVPVDGRELYRYRLADETYARLCNDLKASLAGSLRRPLNSEAAAFCLFGAEWWRREYEGGAWSWGRILWALGLAGDTPHLEIRTAVETGLRLLRRPVLVHPTGHYRDFLVTLACEGGLPLRRLCRDGDSTRLRSHFRSVLEELAECGVSGEEDAAELANYSKRHQDRLPVSFRQPVVHRLVGLLVGRAWALRNKLSGQDGDPISALDRVAQGWRASLPLELDDDEARVLVRGLFRDVETVAVRASDALRIETLLVSRSGRMIVQRVVRSPRALDKSVLDRHFAETPLESDARYQLRLVGTGGDTLNTGSLSVHSDGSGRFVPRKVALEGLPATRSVWLEAALPGGRVLTVGRVFGGAPLGPLPWVFRESSPNEYRLLGCGSVESRAQSVIVASTVGLSGDSELLDVDGPKGRLVHRVSGTATFEHEVGRGTIRTQIEEANPVSYELHGKAARSIRARYDVFLGMPQLERVTVLDRGLIDFEVQRHRWMPAGAEHRGRIRVRHVQEGRLLFSQTVVVLPPDLQLRLGPTTRTLGSIRLTSSELDHVAATSGAGWDCRTACTEADSHRVEVALVAGEAAPAELSLDLSFKQGGSASIRVPFPISSAKFVNPDATLVTSGTAVHVNRIGGMRAIGIARPGARFALHLSVPDSPEDAPLWQRSIDLHLLPSGEHVIDLREAQDVCVALLSATERLDATVQIELSEVGGHGQRPVLNVKRYDWRLERFIGESRLMIVDMTTVSDEAIVEARPFHDVSTRVRLASMAASAADAPSWAFDPREFESGSWLLTARDGDWYRARPMPVSGTGRGGSEKGPLATALDEPTPALRMNAIDAVLVRMASDWAHNDWNLLEDYLRTLGDLPTSTFDVVRRLARTPDALAVAATRVAGWPEPEERCNVWNGLEQLLFLWEAIPWRSWRAAFLGFAEAMDDWSLAASELLARFDRLDRPWARVPATVLRFTFPDAGLAGRSDVGQLPKLAPSFLGQRSTSFDKLRRRNEGLRWPVALTQDAFPQDYGHPVEQSGPPFMSAVANAPVVLAEAAVGRRHLGAATLVFLEECKVFDEQYFHECFEYTFLALAGERTEETDD